MIKEKIEFQKFTFKVIRSLKLDPSHVTVAHQYGTASLDQDLDLAYLMLIL